MREECCSFAEKLTGLFSEIIFKTMHVDLRGELADMDITLAQFQALYWVAEHSGSSVGEVAAGLGVSHPAAIKLLQRLQERGLIQRAVHDGDHRQAVIRISASGLSLVNAVRTERVERLTRVLNQLAPGDRAALIRGLEAFVTVALHDDGALDGICWSCQSLLPSDCDDFSILRDRTAPIRLESLTPAASVSLTP